MSRPALAGLALLVVLPLTAACSPDSDPGAGPATDPGATSGDAQATLASHPVPTKVAIHRVHGRLPEARRKEVRVEVGRVVDRWWEAAYLGGTYPRTDFPSAFPGFTRAAERRAREDKALLTNITGGSRIDEVTPRRRSVRLDILATDRRARAVTAAFVLAFDTTGDKTGTTTVRGRLFLTRAPGGGGWQVFGYDVAKASR